MKNQFNPNFPAKEFYEKYKTYYDIGDKYVVSYNRFYGLVGNDGEEILPPIYTNMHWFSHYVENGFIVVVKGMDKFGTVDLDTGKYIIDPDEFEYIISDMFVYKDKKYFKIYRTSDYRENICDFQGNVLFNDWFEVLSSHPFKGLMFGKINRYDIEGTYFDLSNF